MSGVEYHNILEGNFGIFVTLAQKQRGWKNLRFSLTDKCVRRYWSNL